MNKKAKRTLEEIFQTPVRSNVKWRKVENLFRTLGAEISEGSGSRVRVALKGVAAVFHRPHPQPDTDRGALRSVRTFLENAGVRPGMKEEGARPRESEVNDA